MLGKHTHTHTHEHTQTMSEATLEGISVIKATEERAQKRAGIGGEGWRVSWVRTQQHTNGKGCGWETTYASAACTGMERTGLEKTHLAHVLTLNDVAGVIEYAAHVLRVNRTGIVRIAVVCLAERRAADALHRRNSNTNTIVMCRAAPIRSIVRIRVRVRAITHHINFRAKCRLQIKTRDSLCLSLSRSHTAP